MVHQPLVCLLVRFEPVDALFNTGRKSRSGPLAIGVGFLWGNDKAVCWPALADDLSNRIIDIHHGVHAGKLRPVMALGKRQGGSGLPIEPEKFPPKARGFDPALLSDSKGTLGISVVFQEPHSLQRHVDVINQNVVLAEKSRRGLSHSEKRHG
jgi:hypothetical protein